MRTSGWTAVCIFVLCSLVAADHRREGGSDFLKALRNSKRNVHHVVSGDKTKTERHLKETPLRRSPPLSGLFGQTFNVKRTLSELFHRNERRDTDEVCVSGGPPEQELNFWAGTFLNIFVDLDITCEGQVLQWEYYAQQTGTFYADIWRDVGGEEYELIGSNIISATQVGHQVQDVSLDDRITIQVGDLIGIHYPDETDDAYGGVVTYEDSRRPLTGNAAVDDLSRVYNSANKHSSLLVGMRVSGLLDNIKRLPALKAHVGIELLPGTHMMLGYGADLANETDEWIHATFITDPSQSASHAGHIIGWHLFVANAHPVALQVWRPIEGLQYQLIGETWVYPETTGALHVNLGQYKKIVVKPGDTLGFYFPEGAVIPFDRYTPCNNYNAHRYYAPYGFASSASATESRSEMGDAITFEVGHLDWGACRKYSFSAEIILGEIPGPVQPTSPSGGGGGPVDGSCGNPAIPPNVNNRIVGGVPAIPHSWPWMVSLQSSSGFHYCGGSLVAPQWVITAAHCMPFDSTDRVVVGRHSTSHTSGAEYSVGASYYTYDNYDSYNNDADLALLKLDSPVDFVTEVSPVCIPEQGSGYEVGAMCYTTGWGDTSFYGSSPEVLLQVEVPLVSHEQCNAPDWYAGEITENMVCAGYEEGGKDSCQGDSGGPLVCYQNSRWELVGIVSWGYGCADTRKPGVYTLLPNLADWAKTKMETT